VKTVKAAMAQKKRRVIKGDGVMRFLVAGNGRERYAVR
jgi:hypothetical protein